MAQDFLWAIKTDSDYSTSQTRSIITDSKGNIYSTGDFTGTIDFDPSDNSSYLSSTSGGLSDSFILKLDKDKNFLWVKQITSEWLGVGYSIVLDKNENVIVTGLSSGTQIDLNPDPSETFFVENPTNQPGSYVIKLNSNGKFIFGNYYYGAFADESTVDNNNNIITTGTFGGINTDFDFSNNVYLLNPTSGDIFLLKNDSNGHFIWAKKIGGSQRDFAISLTCDKLNDIILKGRFENNISFSNKDYVTRYNTNFICKISEVGKDIWFRQLGYDSGMISNEDKSVKTDDANNIYFTSNYSNLEIPLSFDFGNTKLFLKEKEGGSVFLKLNQNGEYLWNNYIYGDETNETFSLSFDNNYNIYLVTSTRANTYVNNNCNKVYPYKNIGSSNQFLLLKFTQNGKFINFKNIQSGFYVQSDFEDNIFLSGGFRDMPDFDPSPQSSFYMHSFYGSAYILKLAPCTSSIPEADNNQYFCSSAHPTISDLKPCIEIINWYESKTSNIPLERNLPLENGKTYYAAYFESCPENDRLEVTVHLTTPSTLPSITNLAFCKKDNPKLSDITIVGSNLKWYSSSTGGNILPPSTLLQSNTIYYVTQNENINGCESTRVPVIPELNGDDLIINTPQTFCIQQNATLDNIAITGQNIKWYDAATAGTLLSKTTLLQNDVTYYASQTINGCESDRFAIIAKIENTLPPTGDANQPFCSGSNPTIADIIVTGDLVKWYDAASNGTLLPTTINLQDGKTYYASQTANSCESQRFAVTVSVKNTPSAPLELNSRAFCKNENATLNDIQIDGQNLKWYSSNIAASTLPNTTLLENNTTYYVAQTTGCESERTPILVKVNDTNLPIAKAEQTFCIDQNATIADINVQGTGIIWYDAAAAGNTLAETTLLENKTYYATQTLNSCESKRFAVAIKIQDTQNPIAKSPQTFCIQKNAKISDIDINGENIKWFENLSATTTLSETTLLQNGITYYASQTINNCESDRIPVTIKVLEATTGDCINFVDELPYPKFFTPNNDTYNDYWTIDFAYLAPNTGIKIFDRYGKLIKELINNGVWDGNYLDQEQPASDYWFTVTRLNGTEYRGHFSLKR